MDFLRRLLGFKAATELEGEIDADHGAGPSPSPNATEPIPTTEPEQPPVGLACPYCAALLSPPPVRNRRCPHCRQPIAVRRVDQRVVLLTEASVVVFEAERQREANERAWTAEREQGLRHAANVKAPQARREKLAAAAVSAEIVTASRKLYVSAAERSVTTLRSERRWGDVARVKLDLARALYQAAGSPVPPPGEVIEIQRAGMIAALRSMALVTKDVELVGTECCPVCRAENGQVFRVAPELRSPRLPHVDCSKGLCGCDWWPAAAESRSRRAGHPRKPPE